MKIETAYEFVRFSIRDDFQFGSFDDLDWELLYSFGIKHTILGVLFSGVEKLPKSKLPPKQLLMKWFMQVELIKKRNEKLNEAVVDISKQFSLQGMPCCILKGQGNAIMYPCPALRMPGDIDLWPLASRKRLFEYVRKDFPDTEMLYHHLEYPIFKDIMVEVHFFPMFLNNPIYNRRFQKWLDVVCPEQMENWVQIPQGSFCHPTDSFNIIYQLAHIRHHFFDEGIGLRQLMDYYFLIRNQELADKKNELQELLRRFGLLGFAKAVMYVMHEVFNLEKQYWLVPVDKIVGEMLLEEILMTGNFGHMDSRFGDLKKVSRFHRLSMLLKKNIRFMWYFPDEVFFSFLFRLGQPVWRVWANYKYTR